MPLTPFQRDVLATIAGNQARNLDPVELKTRWIEMSDKAGFEITRVADLTPDVPIGVAFVNAAGEPGWIGDDPSLTIHPPGIRGCLPRISKPD